MPLNKNKLVDKIKNEMKFKFRDEDKKQFLLNKLYQTDSSSKTVMLYMSVMRKIDKAEVDNGKEWYYFTKEMVNDAIVEFMSKSLTTLQSYMCIIKDYLTANAPDSNVMLVGYAYTMEINKDDLSNPENGFINKMGEKMQYVTEDELNKLLKCKASDSAKAMAILLFNGIKGEGYCDLANIKSEYVDIKNKVIRNSDDEVIYEIPDDYIKIFEKALREKVYVQYDYKGVVEISNDYADSEYLFKRTAYRLYDGTDPIDMNIINRRIKAFGKAAMNPHITPTSILNSGITLRLLEECGGMPSTIQLNKYKKEHNVKISYNSIQTSGKILLEKLNSPS